MFDFFAILSKSGIVLWYFHDIQCKIDIIEPINALIKSVILQERSVKNFNYGSLVLEYKLDNEFELLFVVGYQKMLSLSYVDKFLTLIEQEFRDRYKDVLLDSNYGVQFNFENIFKVVLKETEEASRLQKHNKKETMSTFEESKKSKKTVKSMLKDDVIKSVNEENAAKKKKGGKNVKADSGFEDEGGKLSPKSSPSGKNQDLQMDEVEKARLAFIQKQLGGSKGKKDKEEVTNSDSSPQPTKKGKAARKWDAGGKRHEAVELDFSAKSENGGAEYKVSAEEMSQYRGEGQMSGGLRDLAEEDKPVAKNSGIYGMFKGLVGGKVLSEEDLAPVLDKFRDHLIAKNVAKDTSEQIVSSVSTKLAGKAVGTFSSVQSTVRGCLEETCIRLLTPHRRVDILRDAQQAAETGRPYVVVFCGVNGVGKSTNLAKIAFWLLENGRRVMIAACDTFRSGAIEQLRTHLRRLEALHPNRVELYGQDYGSNASAVARNAISEAKRRRFDVVLVDTAGRMQDNAPLMGALAKLIHENNPDRVLFVGEALVGNEAVDQLRKFNEALVDLGKANSDDPQSIDGIVLTKFDTVDDKVGAALSMTHHSGQPIVMVGTGQTYTDLKALSAKAVVNALLR